MDRSPAAASRLPTGRILPAAFFGRMVHEVARDLLGMVLVRVLESTGAPGGGERLSGRIVEVEAYDGVEDLACHASKGRTGRTEPMFGAAGRAYIYLVYGMHCCLNVVAGPVGHPAAVLIRALEPFQGTDRMDPGSARPPRIASGPGRLTRALRIGLSLNRADLAAPGELFIERGAPVSDAEVLRGPRIGVEYAGTWARKPWRLGVRGSAALSRPFPATRRTGRRRAGGG